MITASQLAGFCAAHAIWSLSESDTFVPMFAYTTEKDERKMERLVGDEASKVIASGKDKLAANQVDANDAVLLYNGQLTRGGEKVPAVISEMRAYFAPSSEAVVVVPYTPKGSGKFAVHKPVLLVWKDCEDFDKERALDSFFEGVKEHKQGSKVWREFLDSSK